MENRGGQRPLVRLRRRREDNINIDLKEIGLRGGDVVCVNLDHDKDS